MHTLREAESPGVVRVMTVHKAKGLGFDVVVLPDLQGNSVAQRRNGLGIHRNENHEIDWVLDLPSKMMTETDPVLSGLLDDDVADAGYEALCKLYVALTRAKRALHVVIEPVGRSRSRNFPKLIHTALGDEWARGDARWFEAIAMSSDEPIDVPAPVVPLAPERRMARRVALTPIDLWRERSFEIVLEGSWVTGVFDRVMVWRGADGKAERATVVDFKTDAVDSPKKLTQAIQRHRPQLEIYRKVVARLTRMSTEHVDVQIVFTAIGRAVRLE